MNIKVYLKNALKPFWNIAGSFVGFFYDFLRFAKYGGWHGGRSNVNDYKAVKVYHRLEKSLSFRNRGRNAGWGAATDLVRLLTRAGFRSEGSSFHEVIGVKVLRDFVSVSDGHCMQRAEVEKFLRTADVKSKEGGVIELAASHLQAGKLDDPERFFLSRYSVRDFRPDPVPEEVLRRALVLALKTPSVCNRQAWHVYHISERARIDSALALQNGNRGFGHEIPCLLIITADLSAFDTRNERFQHWIDGGMFSMSMVMALHSLGISTCCLNWSKGAIDDLRLRKIAGIRGPHTVVMMMAAGYPNENLKVCYSARKPVCSFLTSLG